MKYIVAVVAALAIATSIANAQDTCPCVEYSAEENCDVLTIVGSEPLECSSQSVQCNGCRCAVAGETPTGTCNLAASTNLFFTTEVTNPGPCDFKGFSVAECPTVTTAPTAAPSPTHVPNPFTVTCGASQRYGSAFSCRLPTNNIGSPLTLLSCDMLFTWSSNFSDNISNPSDTDTVTGTAILSETHTVQYTSAYGFDSSMPDILTNWDAIPGIPDVWVADDREVNINLAPQAWQIESGSNGPSGPGYTSKSSLLGIVNTLSGATNGDPLVAVNLQFTYNPGFAGPSVNVDNTNRFFSDYRSIVCLYAT